MNKTLPWWLKAGPGRCPFRAGGVPAYCADCDRPMCPTCLTQASVLCPLRAEEGGA